MCFFSVMLRINYRLQWQVKKLEVGIKCLATTQQWWWLYLYFYKCNIKFIFFPKFKRFYWMQKRRNSRCTKANCRTHTCLLIVVCLARANGNMFKMNKTCNLFQSNKRKKKNNNQWYASDKIGFFVVVIEFSWKKYEKHQNFKNE